MSDVSYYNSERYPDPTAYAGLTAAIKAGKGNALQACGVYLFALLGQHQAEYSECPTLLQIRSRQRLHTSCAAPFVSAVYK